MQKIVSLICLMVLALQSNAQDVLDNKTLLKQQKDSTEVALRNDKKHNSSELDLVDIARRYFAKKRALPNSPIATTSKPIQISAMVAPGYSLQTGFAGIAFANAAFNTDKEKTANVSSLLASITYTQYYQIIFPFQANIWTKKNKYNIVFDWRFIDYPSFTYGLGGHTLLSDGYSIDYSSIRLHQKVFRSLFKNFYAGIGFDYDYFWNVREINPPPNKVSDFEMYGLTQTATASGLSINLLFDNRTNSINPDKGLFANASLRNNYTFLGSDADWQSLQIDFRAYKKFPENSHNVLAFWNYDWLTLSGNPPYLLLPNTGGDPSSNSGRGYIQGRYRGKNLLYGETEYRFQITHNGLVGGVVFVNGETVSEQNSGHFETFMVGYGAGIRLKLNKFSKTNIAVDYGLGAGGSRGFFVNLGEVF